MTIAGERLLGTSSNRTTFLSCFVFEDKTKHLKKAFNLPREKALSYPRSRDPRSEIYRPRIRGGIRAFTPSETEAGSEIRDPKFNALGNRGGLRNWPSEPETEEKVFLSTRGRSVDVKSTAG